MKTFKTREYTGIILSLLILAVAFSSSFRLAYSFPDAFTVTTGQPIVFETGLPIVSVHCSNVGSWEFHRWAKLPVKMTMDTCNPGEYSVEFRLFGLIPIRRVSLVVEDPILVVPGGHSIGVILRSSGLVVSGLSAVRNVDGKDIWPARNSGIEVGDIILSVGDNPVTTKEEFVYYVGLAGKQDTFLDLVVEKSDGSVVRRALWPVKHKDGGYKVGLLVKDSLAGVGTLTFYHQDSLLYTALGHVITDDNSRLPAIMTKGNIVRATVTGVHPSKKGEPGEILGVFVEGQDIVGSITKNGPCGITGVLDDALANPWYPKAIPLGYQSQVKKGPAVMLTTINGRQIQAFDIEIEQVFYGTGSTSKGFVIRVTDPKLLSVTGGIVQGMSGSPIIQDGLLVGAVTHVLINDPACGYGTFAEWMANEAYLINRSIAMEVEHNVKAAINNLKN